MSTRDGSTGPAPAPPAPAGSPSAASRDHTLAIVGLVVGAVVGLGGLAVGYASTVYSSDRAAQESLVTAQRLAWASYLGTLDELDRIQPDLTTDPPGPRAMARWEAAYPNVSSQGAAVIILSDDATATLVQDFQDDQLSVVDEWVKAGTWRDDAVARNDLDTTSSVKRLTRAAQDSVRG